MYLSKLFSFEVHDRLINFKSFHWKSLSQSWFLGGPVAHGQSEIFFKASVLTASEAPNRFLHVEFEVYLILLDNASVGQGFL